MREREPTTQKLTTAAASRALPDLVQRISRRETRVVLEDEGKPVAAIISADDLERLTEFEVLRAERFRALGASWEAFKDVDPECIDTEVSKAVGDARRSPRKGGGDSTSP
jgi:prevent-host-death family protein